jgi:uncharacterized protein YPO0396
MSATELDLGFDEAPGGWRLERLEMVNWGTFGDGRVHVLEPAGGWSLLVGENGSGKSTAIDALRTLLAPRTLLRGSFNDAAGGQNRRDRTLASYVRGQWSASRDEESPDTRARFLRPEDTPSFLLGVFGNRRTTARLTLAQVLWVSGGSDKTVFAISDGDRSIEGDLQELGSGRELKRNLRERKFTGYDSYAGYARAFMQKMDIPGEGAMAIFNQAIGIKEVFSVRYFLRSYLLTPGAAVDMIRDRLIPGFSSLEDCWESIQRDKRQLELLAPVVEAGHEAAEAAEKKRRLDALLELAPGHYDRLHRDLLGRDIEDRRAELKRLDARIAETREQVRVVDERQRGLQRQLDNHADSARIGQLELEIERQTAALEEIRRNKAFFDQTTRQEDLGPEAGDPASFEAVQARAAERAKLRDEEAEAATRRAEGLGLDARDMAGRLENLRETIDELRKRRVLIDLDFQRIREWLCAEFGLEISALPFAGELIEVKPEREDWHGAIERLMRGFGISLLVPEAHYREVAGLINRTRLIDARKRGLRLGFHRVPDTRDESPEPEPDTVGAYLNFRDDHPLHRWVAGEVSRQFPHRCCENVADLESARFGLTREGLIRGGTRHVKDDRHRIDDRTQYILGWSPEKKLAALEEEAVKLERDLERARRGEREARALAKRAAESRQALDLLREVSSFASIDLTGGLEKLERFEKEKAEIESRSLERKALQERLEQAAEELQTLRDREYDQRDERSRKDDRLAEKFKARERLEEAIPPDPEHPEAADLEYLAGIEGDRGVTLESVVDLKAKALDTLRNRASQQQAIRNRAEQRMGAPMANYLREFPEEAKDLLPQVEYAEDFIRIYRRVETDDLPSHEERFRTFLNDNLTQNIASLDAALDAEVRGHRERIAQVNRALRELDYSGHSYVEIHDRERGEQAVTRFKGQLREILGIGMRGDEGARLELFGKIRDLVVELRKPEWLRLVADSRNWLDFGIRERDRRDDREIDYFDSSQGKSGGQKAKLAFTILAASLCAQYGLADGSGDGGFRLVVIDEIFARTDEANSRRALELFRSMGFQLLLAAPWEAKVKIAEPFVDSYHLAVNPEHHHSSLRRASRDEYEQAAPAP